MPYVAVTYVDLTGRDRAAGDKLLDERVIPMLKGQAGFQTARILRSLDGSTGISAVTFDSEANAKASLTGERAPEAPPVKSTEVYELIRSV